MLTSSSGDLVRSFFVGGVTQMISLAVTVGGEMCGTGL